MAAADLDRPRNGRRELQSVALPVDEVLAYVHAAIRSELNLLATVLEHDAQLPLHLTKELLGFRGSTIWTVQ